jgi:hypothetical protein
MLLKIQINISVALLTLLMHLLRQKTEIENLKTEEIYATSGLRAGKFMLTRAPEKLTHKAALAYCRSLRQGMFLVKNEFYLDNIFLHFNLEETWVFLYKSSESGTLADYSGYPPEILAQDATIGLPSGTTLATMVDATHSAILKRAGGGYTYDTALRTEQKDTLCINNLSFPYREEDQLSIREMIKALAELVEEQILSLRDLKKAMVSEMQILPKLSDTKVNMTVDDTIALDQLVEKSLNQSIDTFAIILEDLKNLKHASDMTTVLAKFLKYTNQIAKVKEQITQPIREPGGLIDSIILPPVNFLTNDSTKIRTFQVGSDTLFTIFGLDSVVEDSFTVWERIKILVNSEHFWMFTLVDIILIITGILVSFFAFLSIVIKMCKKKDYVLVPHNPVVKSVRQPPIVKNRNDKKQKRIRQQTLPSNIPRLRPAPEMPNNGNFELPVWLMNSDLSLDQV